MLARDFLTISRFFRTDKDGRCASRPCLPGTMRSRCLSCIRDHGEEKEDVDDDACLSKDRVEGGRWRMVILPSRALTDRHESKKS